MNNYLYFSFSEYHKKVHKSKSSKYNSHVSVSSSHHMNIEIDIKDFPHVVQSINDFMIYTNQIKEINGEYQIVFNKIDTRLLSYEESEDLLNRLILETLNEKTLKMYKKYTALKNITD